MVVVKGKLIIIVYVVCNNIKDSMELVCYVESLGVDVIVMILLIYFCLLEYLVVKYWNDISFAVLNIDYVIYNIF